MIIKHYICQQSASNVGKSIKQLSLIHNESFFYQCCTDIPTDKKSIVAVIEHPNSILAFIKHLDDVDNYEDWRIQVRTCLMDLQLWDIVEGTNEPSKVENDDPAFIAWSEKNALAFRVIVFLCGYRLRFAIWWITSAKIAWDTLVEICRFSRSRYIGISRSLSKKCTCSQSKIFKVGYVVYIYIYIYIKKSLKVVTLTRFSKVPTFFFFFFQGTFLILNKQYWL